jgi:hypothetical protein
MGWLYASVPREHAALFADAGNGTHLIEALQRTTMLGLPAMSAYGTKRTFRGLVLMSAFGGKADISRGP